MLDQGVIQHSRSSWNSPLFLVLKKDGSFRPVIDFRKVNEITEDDRYPMPVLGDLLMSLWQGNTIFSSLDLLSGYWQAPMAVESREITAFSIPSGHFEWLWMPFGLKTAPITFLFFLSEDDQYIALRLNRKRRLCVSGRLNHLQQGWRQPPC